MPDLKKPKYKKLVFDYSQHERGSDHNLHTVHAAILARINKLLSMLCKRVTQYRYSVHIDIDNLELTITDPVSVRFKWHIHEHGDFDRTITIHETASDTVYIEDIYDEVAYTVNGLIHGNDRRQAGYFAQAMARVLSDAAMFDREYRAKLLAVAKQAYFPPSSR